MVPEKENNEKDYLFSSIQKVCTFRAATQNHCSQNDKISFNKIKDYNLLWCLSRWCTDEKNRIFFHSLSEKLAYQIE